LYLSELTKVKNQSARKLKDKQFIKILKLFTDGAEPLSLGMVMTPAEKKQFLQSLITDQFPLLKDELLCMDLKMDAFQSLVHTFAYVNDLELENGYLKGRVESLRDIRRFTAVPNSILLPRQSIPSEPPSPPPTRSPSARTSTLQSARSGLSSARAPGSFVELEDPDDNLSLREQLSARETEIKENRRSANRLKDLITAQRQEASKLEAEIRQLEVQLKGLEEEFKSLKIDQKRVTAAKARESRDTKREANQVTIDLHIALAENRRLKRIEASMIAREKTRG
jgi:hypothetical protein